MAAEKWEDYKNPSVECTYPFTPELLGYCWSYAHHVDGTKGYEDIEKICKGCDFFQQRRPKVKHGSDI